jgi:presenilin 1
MAEDDMTEPLRQVRHALFTRLCLCGRGADSQDGSYGTREEQPSSSSHDFDHVAAIIRPVATCMVLASLAVAFVRDQSIDQALSSGLSTYLIFNQDSSSSSGKSDGTLFGEGLVNAIVIVSVIAAATFLMGCCIYWRVTWLLALYIMFAMTMLLGYTGGVMLWTALVAYNVPMSYPTMVILMWNLAIVGVVSIFYQKGVPRGLTQWYLILVSCIMAWTLSKFPEWTSWALLIMLALYDLCAVLTPCGPLRWILHLVQTREVQMSGLVYEANVDAGTEVPEHLVSSAAPRDTLVTGRRPVGTNVHNLAAVEPERHVATSTASTPAVVAHAAEDEGAAASSSPVLVRRAKGDTSRPPVQTESPPPANEMTAIGQAMQQSIKLGLGDFVFYSVLVSRAALSGVTTFAACFVAILCGLGGTIALLAVIERALPALPISIFLGVVVFFLLRLTVIPLVVMLGVEGMVM